MHNKFLLGVVFSLLASIVGVLVSAEPQQKVRTPMEDRDWTVWGGGPENQHYSPLAQVNRSNVNQLQVAWSFDTEELGGLQTSPIVVKGVLYGLTPTQKIFALDAATGTLLWKFDSQIKGSQPDRGLAYWSNGTDQRVLAGVMNFVYELDATTGKAVPTFGQDAGSICRKDWDANPGGNQSR